MDYPHGTISNTGCTDKMRKYVQDALLGALISGVLFASVVQGYTIYKELSDRSYEQIPVSVWFEPMQLYIPDFFVGEDPFITYDRKINKTFTAIWSTNLEEILPTGGTVLRCSGFGKSQYETTRFLPQEGITLSWFMDKTCVLHPGSYRVKATWAIGNDQGLPDKEAVLVSNVFTVQAPI